MGKVDNNEQKKKINRIKSECALIDQNSALLVEDLQNMELETVFLNKEIFNLTRNEKEKKEMDEIDLCNWAKWSSLDVVDWFFAIENGAYMKYERTLSRYLTMENVRGSDLHFMNED